jgi:hypothetical protein
MGNRHSTPAPAAATLASSSPNCPSHLPSLLPRLADVELALVLQWLNAHEHIAAARACKSLYAASGSPVAWSGVLVHIESLLQPGHFSLRDPIDYATAARGQSHRPWGEGAGVSSLQELLERLAHPPFSGAGVRLTWGHERQASSGLFPSRLSELLRVRRLRGLEILPHTQWHPQQDRQLYKQLVHHPAMKQLQELIIRCSFDSANALRFLPSALPHLHTLGLLADIERDEDGDVKVAPADWLQPLLSMPSLTDLRRSLCVGTAPVHELRLLGQCGSLRRLTLRGAYFAPGSLEALFPPALAEDQRTLTSSLRHLSLLRCHADGWSFRMRGPGNKGPPLSEWTDAFARLRNTLESLTLDEVDGIDTVLRSLADAQGQAQGQARLPSALRRLHVVSDSAGGASRSEVCMVIPRTKPSVNALKQLLIACPLLHATLRLDSFAIVLARNGDEGSSVVRRREANDVLDKLRAKYADVPRCTVLDC